MLNQNKISAAFMAAALTLSISSCKKEVTPTKSPSAINQVEANKVAKQLLSIAMPSNSPSMSFKDGEFDCVKITTDSISVPNNITFDYGTGCKDNNGIIRKGIILVTYNNSDIQNPGTLINYSFKNFFINNDQVKGSLSMENTGVNSNGNMVIKYISDCQDISLENGITQLDAQENLEWVAGGKTWLYTDDVFSITGYTQIATPDGRKSRVTIKEPLILNSSLDCNKYYVKGTTITESSDAPDTYLDYGDGTCDNLAVQTVNGVSKTIELE